MKRLLIALLSVFLLTGCGLFDRGNYEKDRSGFITKDNLIVSYHTNAIGEIDMYKIDQIMSFFEALDYTEFDINRLADFSKVTPEELLECGIEYDHDIPKFIRIKDQTYFHHIRDNGFCTYDEYIFGQDGDIINVLTTQRFKSADFTINPFEDIVFIENIYQNNITLAWEKELTTVLPMSLTQSGEHYGETRNIMEEYQILEFYIIKNQSINLLKLKEVEDDSTNIWSEQTIESLGRDSDIVKRVRLENIEEILELMNDSLKRLGMFN